VAVAVGVRVGVDPVGGVLVAVAVSVAVFVGVGVGDDVITQPVGIETGSDVKLATKSGSSDNQVTVIEAVALVCDLGYVAVMVADPPGITNDDGLQGALTLIVPGDCCGVAVQTTVQVSPGGQDATPANCTV
jgi:hypothetical protein